MPARDEPDLDPALADAVRRAYVRPVDEVTASRHVSAMVAAADAGADAPAPRPSRSRLAWRPLLGAGAVATLLLPVGLAAAGVSLPRAVEEPYRAVGISLPNQAADDPAPAKPSPVTPGRSATTPRTTVPARPGARGSGASKTSRTPGRPASSGRSRAPGTSGRPATSKRPSTSGKPSTSAHPAPPPSAGSTGGGSNANPASRRPAASPKKPAAAKPGTAKPKQPATAAKPAKPAKPAAPQSTRPNPAGRPVTDPGAPSSQNGNRQPG